MAVSHSSRQSGTAHPETETFHLAPSGAIPNSTHPALLYRDAFSPRGDSGAQWLEERFADNGWTDAWRWTVYPFHHFHSNTHEVLGAFKGEALLQLGGDNGPEVRIRAGDVLVIPAGVAHRRLQEEGGFQVVGAYPGGREPDMRKGLEKEGDEAAKASAEVPIPEADPLLGQEGLRLLWR